jgi:steroid 5-alpha reductase family enzyme
MKKYHIFDIIWPFPFIGYAIVTLIGVEISRTARIVIVIILSILVGIKIAINVRNRRHNIKGGKP